MNLKIIVVALIFMIPSLGLSQFTIPSLGLSQTPSNDEILQNANYCFSSILKERSVQASFLGGITILCGDD